MKLNERQSAFLDWLSRLLDETSRLQRVLEQERDVLLESKLESLQMLVEEKNTLVDRIESLLVQLPGNAEQKEDVLGEMIRALKLEDSQVVGLWQEVKRRMGECRTLNESNGATISLLQEYNQQALVLLFGHRRDRVCYGADGQSRSGDSDRLLVTT